MASPILAIVDVQPKELGIPTKAYCCVDEVRVVSAPHSACGMQRTYARMNCLI